MPDTDLSNINPPAVTRGVDDLTELAGRINAEHHQGEQAARQGLAHFRAAGEALLEAKRRCGHGKFLPWLKANVRFSGRTARDYMRLAENWGKVAAAANLRDALRLLADDEGEEGMSVEEFDRRRAAINANYDMELRARRLEARQKVCALIASGDLSAEQRQRLLDLQGQWDAEDAAALRDDHQLRVDDVQVDDLEHGPEDDSQAAALRQVVDALKAARQLLADPQAEIGPHSLVRLKELAESVIRDAHAIKIDAMANLGELLLGEQQEPAGPNT